MAITDEMLGAFVDGELDATQVRGLEAAIAADAQLTARVAAARALRLKLRARFDQALQEPTPERLLQVAREGQAGAATVTAMAARPGRAAPTARTWAWQHVTALAASALLGAVAVSLWRQSPGAAPIAYSGGQLMAQAGLRAALETQLASAQNPSDPTQIALSFRNHDGRYCRSFTFQDHGAIAGLACRSGTGWSIEATAPVGAAPKGSGVRMAASPLPPGVLSAINVSIDGDALDADGERRAVAAGWR